MASCVPANHPEEAVQAWYSQSPGLISQKLPGICQSRLSDLGAPRKPGDFLLSSGGVQFGYRDFGNVICRFLFHIVRADPNPPAGDGGVLHQIKISSGGNLHQIKINGSGDLHQIKNTAKTVTGYSQ